MRKNIYFKVDAEKVDKVYNLLVLLQFVGRCYNVCKLVKIRVVNLSTSLGKKTKIFANKTYQLQFR